MLPEFSPTTPCPRPRATSPARSLPARRGPLARLLPLVALAAALPAFPKGILVRFLGAAPGDSVVRYDVYRQAAGDSVRLIGAVAAGTGADTVAFPDSGAERGLAYRYSMRAVDASGRESEPSDSTLAAIPRLSVPDTLRASAWPVAWTLPASAHPLRGSVSLALALAPGPGASAAGLSLAYDTVSGRVEFRAVPAPSGALRVVLRGSYLGKFSDADTVVIVAGAGTSIAPAVPASGAAIDGPPAFRQWRGADGRALPALVTRRVGSRRLFDAAGRGAGNAGRP